MMDTTASELMGVLTTVACVLGLAVGSFLNVVIYRVPLGLSIVTPPSACPRCGAGIRPVDNIPVLSWLVLRGKCRSCASAISARYPLVELGTGVAFVSVSLWALVTRFPTPGSGAGSSIGAVLVLVAFLFLAAVSIALALIDLDVHRLPDSIVLPSFIVGGVLLGAAAILVGDLEAVLRACIGMGSLCAAYLAMSLAYPGGMGFGDVKLAGLLGLYLGYLGWGELAVGAFAAFLLGGVFGIGLLVTRRATSKSGIPFGPWMLTGAWVGAFWGGQLWNGYLSIIGIVQ
jgi:leader peptidase (prepilin peptidase)/N-methyltransferase